ncbi:MAG: hypothetical protein EOP05_08105 [Proteobacteria bacterium]|nr:MAG: hypothetical protein EOP05_08105 [Pseudomonadota bacterium]
MKFAFLLVLLLSSSFALAQTAETDFLKSRFEGGFTTFEKLSEKNARTLKLATALAREKGIEVSLMNLPASEGRTYEALVISPQGSSPQNLEAKRVAEEFSGLPLVFSPMDLSHGSEAYFMADGSHLGVPYAFFTQGSANSSYRHELQHATTQNQLIKGESPLWGGVVKLSAGTPRTAFVTRKNVEGYSSAAALDEILTTALSAHLETQELMELQSKLPRKEFVKQWGPGREKLASIYRALEAGIALSKQTSDVATRALESLEKVEITDAPLTIGTKTSQLQAAVFKMDAFEYGSSVKMKPIPFGTIFILYSASRPSEADLKTRLETIRSKSNFAEAYFKAALEKIFKGLVHVEVEKSDLAGLVQLAGEPLKILTPGSQEPVLRACSHAF